MDSNLLTLSRTLVFAVSMFFDRYYYREWSLPAYRFLHFNIAQSLAVFYGSNPWHYYLSQGVPLLTTTILPFSLSGLLAALRKRPPPSTTMIAVTARFQLAITFLFVITALSLVSHKEVRFIYPLLPLLHLFAAESLYTFLLGDTKPATNLRRPTVSFRKRLLVAVLLSLNVAIAFYTTRVHQTGVLSVLDFLRNEHESRRLAGTQPKDMTVGFLMPCHSTPWRAHLVYPSIKAWALECEPPVNLTMAERESYVDEADRFYNDPISFMRNKIGDYSPKHNEHSLRYWPDYLVFFAQLEDILRSSIEGSSSKVYKECWRGFNTHWHDDWRRKGDVVVWCRQ